ncbi:MAG: hypothetical protein ACFCGT_04170 [Sandaracinaceae bacterium]
MRCSRREAGRQRALPGLGHGRRSDVGWALAALLGPSLVLGGCSTSTCDLDTVSAALLGATPGSVVSLPSCSYEGPVELTVPAGVTLRGSGRQSTVLRSLPEDASPVALNLLPGTSTQPTRVIGLALDLDGPVVAIRALAPEVDPGGSVVLEDVRVQTRTGVAVAAQHLSALTLRDVELVGAVPDSASLAEDSVFTDVATAMPDPLPTTDDCPAGEVLDLCETGTTFTRSCERGGCGVFQGFCGACRKQITVTSTVGLYVSRVSDATLENVDIRGFASFGAVVDGDEDVQETVTWTEGTVASTLRQALYLREVDSTLDGVCIERVFAGFAAPSIAFYFFTRRESQLVTSDLRLFDNQGYGLVQQGGVSEHRGLEAQGNTRASLWIADAVDFGVRDSSVHDTDLAGLVLFRTDAAEILRTSFQGIRQAVTLVGADNVGSIRMGDGVHSIRSSPVRFEEVDLLDNQRIGLVMDLFGLDPASDVCRGGEGICFDGRNLVRSDLGVPGALAVDTSDIDEAEPVTTVETSGEPGWSAGLTREGGAEADEGFTGTEIDVVGVIAPVNAPEIAGVIAPVN